LFYTYILRSRKRGKYYVGSTSNLDGRLCEHNRGKTSSTKPGIPWEIVYYEEFSSHKEAVAREMEIKSQKSRDFIERLILKGKTQLVQGIPT